MTSDVPPSKPSPPPITLEYRHPGTRNVGRDFAHPGYACAMAVCSAAVGLAAPTTAGGHPVAWLGSLGLTVAACWYAVVRSVRGRRGPLVLRLVSAVCSCCAIVATALLATGNGLAFAIMEWRAYREAAPFVWIVVFCVASAVSTVCLLRWLPWATLTNENTFE